MKHHIPMQNDMTHHNITHHITTQQYFATVMIKSIVLQKYNNKDCTTAACMNDLQQTHGFLSTWYKQWTKAENKIPFIWSVSYYPLNCDIFHDPFKQIHIVVGGFNFLVSFLGCFCVFYCCLYMCCAQWRFLFIMFFNKKKYLLWNAHTENIKH